MTLTVRMLAQLFHPETHDLLASGIAVIWNDLQEWGGIFEPQEYADELRAAVADRPMSARLETLDGRRATITLAPSTFVADGVRPLTFRGYGEIDTMHDREERSEIRVSPSISHSSSPISDTPSTERRSP